VPGGYQQNRNRDLMVIRVALEVHTHSSRNMKDWVSGIETQFWNFLKTKNHHLQNRRFLHEDWQFFEVFEIVRALVL
jgi:hypothetical protein